MTNLGYFDQWFEEHKAEMVAGSFAVSKKTKRPAICENINCSECLFESDARGCTTSRLQWLNSEHSNPQIDLSKLKKDDRILVSDNNRHWQPAHFAKIGKNGKVRACMCGGTSWTTTATLEWTYVRLPED